MIHESFDSEEEANLRIAQILLEKKNNKPLPPASVVDPDANHALAQETMTVSQLLDEYVNLYGLNHWSESTLSSTMHRITHYINPYIGAIPIKSLTTHRLERFYRKLLREPAVCPKGKEHLQTTIAPSVVEKVHGTIRSALNQAIRWDYLKGPNPAMTVELPKYKNMIITVKDADKGEAIEIGRRFEKLGYTIYATRSTAAALNEAGVKARKVNKISQESPTVMDLILGHKIDLVIDTPTQGRDKTRDGFLIRRTAIETGIYCITAMDTANALVTSMEHMNDCKELTLVDIAQL